MERRGDEEPAFAGFGASIARSMLAFSAVVREASSSRIRSRLTPNSSSSCAAIGASDTELKNRLPLPPENAIRACGNRRASRSMVRTRSADASSSIVLRAADASESMAPPSTMMPSGLPARLPRRKALGQPQQQDVAERRQAGERKQHGRADQQAEPVASPARQQEHHAGEARDRDQVGRDGEEAGKLSRG